MNPIIFLDIDGVLNNTTHFKKTYEERKKLYQIRPYTEEIELQAKLLELDFKKLNYLIKIIEETNAKIVITSCWKNLKIYPKIKEKLIELGIPIIGEIQGNQERGKQIRNYIKEHKIKTFIVIDDSIFEDFHELTHNLIKTDNYKDGLTEKQIEQAIQLIKKK